METTEEDLRNTGISVLPKSPWGSHLSLFYATDSDLMDVVVSYFKIGLAANEFCLWITSSEFKLEEVATALKHAEPKFERDFKEGRIEIVKHREWHLKDDAVDEDKILKQWNDKLIRAEKRGYSGMRAIVDEARVDQTHLQTLYRYEEKLGTSLLGRHILVLSAYSLDGTRAEEMLDVARTHRFTLGKRGSKWDVFKTIETNVPDEAIRTNDLEPRLQKHTPGLSDAAKSLQQSEGRFYKVFNASPIGISITRIEDGQIIDVNDAFLKMLGYRKDEVLGRTTADLKVWVQPEHRRELARKILLAGVKNMETKLRTKDGQVKDVLFSAELIQMQGGPFLLSLVPDITERKKAEDAFKASEAELRGLFAAMTDVVFELDSEGRYLKIATTNPNLLHRPAADLLGKMVQEIFPEDKAEFILENVRRALKTQRAHSVEYDLEIGGEFIWFDATVSPMSHDSVFWIARDITERKRAEREIIRKESYLRHLFLSSPTAMAQLDTAGCILDVNKSFENIFKYTIEEIRGRPLRELIAPVDRLSEAKDVHQRALSGETTQFETKRRRKDGVFIDVLAMIIPVMEEKICVAIYAIHVDLTAQKQLEAQLLRAQRLESLGTLAGGIAHDLNNVLAPILLGITGLKRINQNPNTQPLLDIIERSTQRGSDIVKQVLSFARGAAGERMVLQLRTLANEIGNIVKETFPRSIQMEVSVPKDLWTVTGDPTQLDQVLMNLCVNARDAMPNGGRLEVIGENIVLDEMFIRQNPGAQIGRYICLTVADTGSGIPAEILDKIFDPFFTTKEIGKGTGLGLSTVFGIVKSHNGFVNVESTPGKGTKFRVYLPASEAEVQAQQAKKEVSVVPVGQGEVVLFVDDEAAIREITKSTLESFGYQVLTANDGIHGLSIYFQHRDEIDVLVTDMMMPFLDGLAVVDAIRKLVPDLKIIAITGLVADTKMQQLHELQGVRILKKPFTGEQLLRALDELLHNKVKSSS